MSKFYTIDNLSFLLVWAIFNHTSKIEFGPNVNLILTWTFLDPLESFGAPIMMSLRQMFPYTYTIVIVILTIFGHFWTSFWAINSGFWSMGKK